MEKRLGIDREIDIEVEIKETQHGHIHIMIHHIYMFEIIDVTIERIDAYYYVFVNTANCDTFVHLVTKKRSLHITNNEHLETMNSWPYRFCVS